MAEEAKKQEQAPTEKNFPIKTVGILALVFIIEGLAITGAFMMAGKPADAKGNSDAEIERQRLEKPVEELVLEEKFQNTSTGRAYLYDTQIYIVVRAKHQDAIKKELETKQAQITTAISRIFRQAEQVHLLEPTLATITRQITSEMEKIISLDEETKKTPIERVLIRKCTQFRADM